MRDRGRKLLLSLTVCLSGVVSSASASPDGPLNDREYLLSVIAEREKQYQQRFEAQERALAAALSSAKEAVEKAERASEKRFDAVNEFRAALTDQQRNLLPRTEYTAQHKALEDMIKELASRVDTNAQRQYVAAGQAEASARLWGFVIGGGGIVIAFITLVLNFYRFKQQPTSV